MVTPPPETKNNANHGNDCYQKAEKGHGEFDQLQKFDGHIIGADLDNPDMVKLAESFGADAYRVDSPTALKPVLAKAIDNDRPAVIDVTVERGSEASPWKYLVG